MDFVLFVFDIFHGMFIITMIINMIVSNMNMTRLQKYIEHEEDKRRDISVKLTQLSRILGYKELKHDYNIGWIKIKKSK